MLGLIITLSSVLLNMAARAAHSPDPNNFINSLINQTNLFCDSNTSDISLSWCQYKNPFILSDFLARNSSEITSGTSGTYQLDIFCSNRSTSGGYTKEYCEAIQSIGASTFGLFNLTHSNLTNYIIFTDLSGRLLFVNFNDNTMADSLTIDVSNVNKFDVTSIEYLNPHGADGWGDVSVVQDSVFLIANNSQMTMVLIFGRNGTMTKPCPVINNQKGWGNLLTETVFGQFYSQKSNASDTLINMAWAILQNYSQRLMHINNDTSSPSWTNDYNYYGFYSTPTKQSDVADYIVHRCGVGTPSNMQLGIQFFSTALLRFETVVNSVSGLAFVAAYSSNSINLYRLEYNGTYDVELFNQTGYYFYERNVIPYVDWCTPRTIYDNATNSFVPVNRSRSTIYCAPPGAVIDYVSFIPSENLDQIGPYNRLISVVVAMHNSTAAFWKMISLDELVYIAKENSTFHNPLGLPPTFGTPQFPCQDFAAEWYDPVQGVCHPRYVFDYAFVTNEPITKVQIQLVSGFQTNSSFASLGNDYSLLFIARNATVSIFAMFSTPEPPPINVRLNVVHYNDIAFIGDISYMFISPNSMHLFAAVRRPKWELDSQQRYLDICQTLANDPSDLFLSEGFSQACASQPGQAINLNAFTQYASYCQFNLYCPSLSDVVVRSPPAASFADRPAVAKICPKGHFCFGGSKQSCPPGFYCPNEGMTLPKRCPLPFNSNSTCSEYGLTQPAPCREGTYCSLTHIPGLPAPPGFMVPTPPHHRNEFITCDEGMWCTLGAQAAYPNSSVTNSTFDCPMNTFCGNSSVVEPELCLCNQEGKIWSANRTLINCDSRTLFCPPRTTDVNWCPAGFYCTMPNISQACYATQYCPPGTFAPLLCPEGVYCPTPGQKLTCPQGSFCPQGSTEPSPCNFLTVCPLGSAAQTRSFLGPFILLFVVAGVLVGFFVFKYFDKKQQKRDEGDQPLSAAARKYVNTAGDDADEVEMPLNADAEKHNSATTAPANIPTSRFQTPTIHFQNMGLKLLVGEAKGKVVLDNVTGVIPPGSFVAVMGPSGSGKSTFMHTLAGKAFYGERMGKVLINNDEVDLTMFSKIVGFVKQDDIMLREMTVAETLLFNARMRYDEHSIDRPTGLANAMLRALDLCHVRDIPIGDEKKRGISGGQRKRVNIGMELVALPSILFLDEPTSGLDSSSSMTVCGALRQMADVGISVIAVIHQPRYEIFQMFHKVLLLAKGGKLVYYGDPTEALSYFEQYLGIPCPQHVNPPDFFMDTISGDTNSAGLSIDDMVKKWNEYAAERASKVPPTPMASREGSTLEIVTSSKSLHARDVEVSGAQLAAMASKKGMPNVIQQLVFFTQRSFVQLSRDLLWFFTDLMLVLVAGFFLGLVFSESQYRPPLPQQIVNKSMSAFGNTPPPGLASFFDRPIDDPIISEASLTCMAIGMTGVTAALRVFGNEQIVYWREASAGMSTASYFFAKNITHLLFIILSPLLYLGPFLTFVSARASFIAYYRVLVLTQFTTVGLGYLISIVSPSGLAQLAGVVVVLVFSMFGGSRPTLVEIKSMFVLLQAMPYVSYIRWAQEALYIEEISEWAKIQGISIEPSLQLFDYHLDDYNMCMYATFIFGVVFRLLALLAMYAMHRDQKH